VLGQKFAGFEFLLAGDAFPDFLRIIFAKFLGLSDENFNFFSEHVHVIFGIGTFLDTFFCSLLNLFEDSLNLFKFLVVSFNSEEG
jgi:hypothetical protein